LFTVAVVTLRDDLWIGLMTSRPKINPPYSNPVH